MNNNGADHFNGFHNSNNADDCDLCKLEKATDQEEPRAQSLFNQLREMQIG